MVLTFDRYGALMINHGNRTLIVFYLCCCIKNTLTMNSQRTLRTILIQNIYYYYYYYLTLYIIYNWSNIMGYSAHEFSTINMLYSLKNGHITPLPPHNGGLQGGCRGEVRRYDLKKKKNVMTCESRFEKYSNF